MPDKKEMTEKAKAALRGFVAGAGASGSKNMGDAGGETGKPKPTGLSEEQIQKMDPPKPQMNNDALKMSPYRNEHALKMESAKQEKYNLMHDNPVDKDASGGRDVSWMSKHVTKLGGSPIKKHCI